MTKVIQFDNTRISLSRPFEHRPEVIVIEASDGRRAILGDRGPFTPVECRLIDGGRNRRQVEAA